jgi:hypothetical protein
MGCSCQTFREEYLPPRLSASSVMWQISRRAGAGTHKACSHVRNRGQPGKYALDGRSDCRWRGPCVGLSVASVYRALKIACSGPGKQHELAAAFASCVGGWNIVQGEMRGVFRPQKTVPWHAIFL